MVGQVGEASADALSSVTGDLKYVKSLDRL